MFKNKKLALLNMAMLIMGLFIVKTPLVANDNPSSQVLNINIGNLKYFEANDITLTETNFTLNGDIQTATVSNNPCSYFDNTTGGAQKITGSISAVPTGWTFTPSIANITGGTPAAPTNLTTSAQDYMTTIPQNTTAAGATQNFTIQCNTATGSFATQNLTVTWTVAPDT